MNLYTDTAKNQIDKVFPVPLKKKIWFLVQRVLKKQSKKKKIFLEKKTNEKLATWLSLIESLKFHF